MNAAESKPTKNQKRQEAREKARALREEQSKKSKRNKIIIQSSLAVGVIGVIALVTVLIISSLRPQALDLQTCKAMASKSARVLLLSGPLLFSLMSSPFPQKLMPMGSLLINIFVDYSCPACAQFESIYGELLRTWAESEQQPWSTTSCLSVTLKQPERATPPGLLTVLRALQSSHQTSSLPITTFSCGANRCRRPHMS